MKLFFLSRLQVVFRGPPQGMVEVRAASSLSALSLLRHLTATDTV
jgi:hypothetical protein